MVEPSDHTLPDEILFVQLVSIFQGAAMQHLGKLVDPATNEAKRDMVQAKAAIDMLNMLKEKTRGNLAKMEDELLGKVLFELQMNYVDELKRDKENSDEDEGTSGGDVDGADSKPESDSAAPKERG